jgi:hypothetical protein
LRRPATRLGRPFSVRPTPIGTTGGLSILASRNQWCCGIGGRLLLEPVDEVVGRGALYYVEHYNQHRAHQASQLHAPDPATGLTIVDEDREGIVHRQDLLGGLLHEYRRAA